MAETENNSAKIDDMIDSEIKKMSESNQSSEAEKSTEQKKPQGKKRGPKPKKKVEEEKKVSDLIDLSFVGPIVENLVNVLFKRLEWESLNEKETESLSMAILNVLEKYSPYILSIIENYSTEINLSMVIVGIVFKRITIDKMISDIKSNFFSNKPSTN